MSRSTKKLIEIIERRAANHDSCTKAQNLIAAGADIRAMTKRGYMIESVSHEGKRHGLVDTVKARNCENLVQLLQHRASDLLKEELFSSNGGNVDEIELLLKLGGNCYHKDYEPLGVLGEALKRDSIPVRQDVVKFLIEKDPYTNFGLTKADAQQRTYLSLAKANPKCSHDVVNFIQNQFDAILNQIPFSPYDIDINQVLEWIHRGANPEATDKRGNTVLSNAVIANNLELVRALIACGCDGGCQNHDRLTPLQIAQNATPRNHLLVTMLTEQSFNTLLKRLIENKKADLNAEEVHALLERGAKINAVFPNNNTPLHVLIANQGTPEMVSAFVNQFHADISLKNVNGYGPIELCVLLDKQPYTLLLATLKLPQVVTDIFFNSKLNKSILKFAIDERRPEAAKLIQHELNARLWNCILLANTDDNHNESILKEANKLIRFGASIDHKHLIDDYEEWTVLHLACKIATRKFVEYLIEQLKANYTIANRNGDHPISIAAKNGRLLIVQYLRGLIGVQLNVSNRNKETPLHLATRNHHLQVVRDLILWGANHEAKNSSGQTSLDVAQTNAVKTKEDETNNKKIISVLQRLICPIDEDLRKNQLSSIRPNHDLDVCELVERVSVDEIQTTDANDFDQQSNVRKNILAKTPNESLHDAAKIGDIEDMKNAIGKGADIRCQKQKRTAYEVAKRSAAEYQQKLSSSRINLNDRHRFERMMNGCQYIMNELSRVASVKLIESIQEGHSGRFLAYHMAGATLAPDLVILACSSSDNVEIVHYLIYQGPQFHRMTFDYTTTESPYLIAKKKNFHKVAHYLKYLLSLECSDAIKKNNLPYVKQLVRADASVDMTDTNNLIPAIEHRNLALVEFLCENGVKMPEEWFTSKNIVLSTTLSESMDASIAFCINRTLINRKLRWAAACGNLHTLVQCQRLGADINSKNCHGSTALLCAIQHGNYFRIVHALISCGATILHSNAREPMSLIELAKRHNYKHIMDYLSEELNTQFITAVLDDNKPNATAFASIGANFNYQDEQKRTPLHYAVQYHGIELVQWLCQRGSTPTIADINGDFPIILAVEKGDFPVVEFFATQYPATKKQTNKSGATPLQVAQNLGFKRVAEFLLSGKILPDEPDKPIDDAKPKHSRAALIQAAKNGHQYKQIEVFEILKAYNSEISRPEASDGTVGNGLSLTEREKQILHGFLGSLSELIAGSSIPLDPDDPNTYREFFSGLSFNLQARSSEAQQANNDRDVHTLSQKDMANIEKKLQKIDNDMAKVYEEKLLLMKRIEEADEQLKQQSLSARQLKEIFENQETFEKQLAGYECSMFLYQREQEAMLNRRNTLKFIKNDTNLYLFHIIIENYMQALFTGIFAAQSGLLTTETVSGYGTAAGVVKAIPTSVIPFSELIVKPITAILSTVFSKLDKKQQKKERYNILMLGNAEELARLASDTATLITLYYKEQIQSINTWKKIKGSNMFNDKVQWINDVFVDVRPEGCDERPVVIVAEYILAWILHDLTSGKLIRTEPLAPQLWLSVAKMNPIHQGKVAAVKDIFGASAGRQMIPLKKMDNDKYIRVELRHFIGCVSVLGNDGVIYQYGVDKKDESISYIKDLNVFGFVYVAPFSDDPNILDEIVTSRKLSRARRDDVGDILTKFDDIVQILGTHQDSEGMKQSSTTRAAALQIAEVLRQESIFINSTDMKTELEKSRHGIEYTINAFQEDMQTKTDRFKTYIDATHEELIAQSKESREIILMDNEMKFSEQSQQLNDIQKQLERRVTQRLKELEQQMKNKYNEMVSIVHEAKVESSQALDQANQAVQYGELSVEKATKLIEQAENLIEYTGQQQQALRKTADNCVVHVEQAILEQKEFYEKSILDIRAKIHNDMENAKHWVEQSVVKANEAATSSQETALSAKNILRVTKEQMDVQRQESERILMEAKEIRKHSEQAVKMAHDAEKQARRAADASVTAFEKLEMHPKKMDTN